MPRQNCRANCIKVDTIFSIKFVRNLCSVWGAIANGLKYLVQDDAAAQFLKGSGYGLKCLGVPSRLLKSEVQRYCHCNCNIATFQGQIAWKVV